MENIKDKKDNNNILFLEFKEEKIEKKAREKKSQIIIY